MQNLGSIFVYTESLLKRRTEVHLKYSMQYQKYFNQKSENKQ